MTEVATLNLELVGHTAFTTPESVRHEHGYLPVDANGNYHHGSSGHGNGEDLIEFAGRACYESWSRPNPKTATVEGYVGHILEVGHGSVLEHASATLYVTGVSRSLTHELVRHRAGFGFSQLSQRYVPAEEAKIVVPPELEGNEQALTALIHAMGDALEQYDILVNVMRAQLEREGVSGTEAKKRARQAARCVLPNMTETRIVVTANARAWRHFIVMRAAAAADHEIRRLAVSTYLLLSELWPSVFQDMDLVDLPDGTRAVTAPEVQHGT